MCNNYQRLTILSDFFSSKKRTPTLFLYTQANFFYREKTKGFLSLPVPFSIFLFNFIESYYHLLPLTQVTIFKLHNCRLPTAAPLPLHLSLVIISSPCSHNFKKTTLTIWKSCDKNPLPEIADLVKTKLFPTFPSHFPSPVHRLCTRSFSSCILKDPIEGSKTLEESFLRDHSRTL